MLLENWSKVHVRTNINQLNEIGRLIALSIIHYNAVIDASLNPPGCYSNTLLRLYWLFMFYRF